jgi:hypothetical protein
MAFSTITARYPGSTCRRCGREIQIGERIRFGGRGNCWHVKADCPAAADQAQARPDPTDLAYEDACRDACGL